MRDQILLDALQRIAHGSFNEKEKEDIATKALSDYASSPKEGLNREEIKNQIIEYMKFYIPDGEPIGAEKIMRLIEKVYSFSSAPESEFWTDETVEEFAKQYRFSSSRISLKMFKEGKGFPYSGQKGWSLNSSKGIRCLNKTTGKYVYAYFIDESGAAHNKNNTTCIGNMFADLTPAPESGGEEKWDEAKLKKWIEENAVNFANEEFRKYRVNDSITVQLLTGFKAGANALYELLRDYVPNKSNYTHEQAMQDDFQVPNSVKLDDDVVQEISKMTDEEFDKNCIEAGKILGRPSTCSNSIEQTKFEIIRITGVAMGVGFSERLKDGSGTYSDKICETLYDTGNDDKDAKESEKWANIICKALNKFYKK